MKLNITLTPLGAYFLGTERNASYKDETNSQQSELNPYFIRSGKYPSQSALLGILRYVGIQNPDQTFSIRNDIDNIGKESYDLLSKSQSFGRIQNISCLMLTDEAGRRYIPAPRNHRPAKWKKDKNDVESAEFSPFNEFSAVKTLDSVRYYPTQYNEKEAWDDAELLCLEDGRLYKSPFDTKVQVGINRQSQKLDEDKRTVSGFFKKEYTVLKKGFSFRFSAEVENDFFYHPQTVAYVGQGHSPFAVRIEKVEEEPKDNKPVMPVNCVPASVKVNGKAQSVCYAVALSDCYYPGDIEALRKMCSFMMADYRSYRVFTTNYADESAESAPKRYRKHDEALKLLKAGSVFFFFGADGQTPEVQRNAFVNALTLSHPQKAGFNQLYPTL